MHMLFHFVSGMEVAAHLVGKAKSVTVLGRSAIPYASVLGEKIGNILLGVSCTIVLVGLAGTIHLVG